MYKIASKNAQKRREKLRVPDLMGGDEQRTPEQHRDDLVRIWKSYQVQLAQCGSREEKKKIGRQIQELQNQINALRPRKRTFGVEDHFIKAARTLLTKAQFDITSVRLKAKQIQLVSIH